MDDDLPRPKGDAASALAKESLDPYSQDELAERIALLEAEIARLEALLAQITAERYELLKRLARIGRKILWKDGQQTRARLDQYNPGRARVDRAEVTRQRVSCKLGDGPGQFNPGGTTTDDDERLQRRWDSGDFRVEEFRIPLVDARVSGPKEVPIAPAALDLAVQLNFMAGGPMAGAPIKASALLRPRAAAMAGYDEFSFQPPRSLAAAAETEDDDTPRSDGRLVADKLALVTDKAGAAKVALAALPKIERPSELLAEVSYNDPNGEVQTVATTLKLWPAAVVPGLRAASWASARGKVAFTALALDTAGKPIKGQALEVRARLTQILSTRKRIVGGFYAYDNRTEVKELGTLCSGASDDRGQLACSATLDTAGQVELVVQAHHAVQRVGLGLLAVAMRLHVATAGQ